MFTGRWVYRKMRVTAIKLCKMGTKRDTMVTMAIFLFHWLKLMHTNSEQTTPVFIKYMYAYGKRHMQIPWQHSSYVLTSSEPARIICMQQIAKQIATASFYITSTINRNNDVNDTL